MSKVHYCPDWHCILQELQHTQMRDIDLPNHRMERLHSQTERGSKSGLDDPAHFIPVPRFDSVSAELGKH
jgi:hypothetical protein